MAKRKTCDGCGEYIDDCNCTLSRAIKERDDFRSKLSNQIFWCVNQHADAGRVVAWLNDPNRPPAISAFSEGPDRQIAHAVERLLK